MLNFRLTGGFRTGKTDRFVGNQASADGVDVQLGSRLLLACMTLLGLLLCESALHGQDPDDRPEAATGYAVVVSLPIKGQTAEQVCNQLERLAGQVGAANQRRQTVVLSFQNRDAAGPAGSEQSEAAATGVDGRGSEFEEALRIARCITGKVARQLKTIAYLQGDLRGHAVLVALACDELVVAPESSFGDASIDEQGADRAIQVVYESIAATRATVPQPAIVALVDPSVALYRVTLLTGAERFVGEPEAAELRLEGAVLREELLSAPGRPLVLTGQQLRQFRWASTTVENPGELASQLGLSKIIEPDTVAVDVKAVRLDVRGPMTATRVRRFRSNLAAALDSRVANSVFVEIDSPGGDLASSLELGLEFGGIRQQSGQSIGYVSGEARGDALLIAVACKPLFMHPQSKLGGGGAATISRDKLLDLQEAIEQLANTSGRPAALLFGLLDPSLEVYQYTQRRTGQVAYFSELDDPEQLSQWQRGDRVELDGGITAAQAVELGLAEDQAESATLAASLAGLDEYPQALSDRRVVRYVEWLGSLPWLGPLLILIGFMAFSMEVSAPGLGLPGFIALVCFMFFFWMKFLAGTAEWLEVVLFVGGTVCILLEVFIIPGVGVFGIGGMLMIISSILLTSQTFVFPQNEYQYQQTLRGFYSVFAAGAGVVIGFIALRYLLPGTPMFKHLVMPGPSSPEMLEQEQREYLVRYDDLLGQSGTAITPLRPAGKAQFGEQVVAVVSDGNMVAMGDKIRVIEVHGNRVVVEPV